MDEEKMPKCKEKYCYALKNHRCHLLTDTNFGISGCPFQKPPQDFVREIKKHKDEYSFYIELLKKEKLQVNELTIRFLDHFAGNGDK